MAKPINRERNLLSSRRRIVLALLGRQLPLSTHLPRYGSTGAGKKRRKSKMNKYQKILTVVALMCFSGITSSFARDGYWWREQNGAVKAVYVAGMNEGADYAARLAQYVAKTTDKANLGGKVVSNILMANQGLFNGDFTAKQLVDGMDRFYSDKRNRSIATTCALHVVDMQLGGASKSDTESLAERFRRVYR
jgi:hypothetical protein